MQRQIFKIFKQFVSFEILQLPIASALQGLHPHTTQVALAPTLPQQTVLIQAQAQQTQAALSNTIAATLAAGPSANGAYANSQQLVSVSFRNQLNN